MNGAQFLIADIQLLLRDDISVEQFLRKSCVDGHTYDFFARGQGDETGDEEHSKFVSVLGQRGSFSGNFNCRQLDTWREEDTRVSWSQLGGFSCSSSWD